MIITSEQVVTSILMIESQESQQVTSLNFVYQKLQNGWSSGSQTPIIVRSNLLLRHPIHVSVVSTYFFPHVSYMIAIIKRYRRHFLIVFESPNFSRLSNRMLRPPVFRFYPEWLDFSFTTVPCMWEKDLENLF